MNKRTISPPGEKRRKDRETRQKVRFELEELKEEKIRETKNLSQFFHRIKFPQIHKFFSGFPKEST